MTENLSACPATFGKISAILIPEAFVAIGLNGPRTSSGALGFGSKVSMWLGPPTRKSMMQFTSASGRFAPCSARSNDGRVRPSGMSAPAWRKSRRVTPSQNRAGRGASRRSIFSPRIEKVLAGWDAGGSMNESNPASSAGQPRSSPSSRGGQFNRYLIVAYDDLDGSWQLDRFDKAFAGSRRPNAHLVGT